MAKAQKLFQCQPLLLTPFYQKTEKIGNIHITKYPFVFNTFFFFCWESFNLIPNKNTR